METDVSVIIPHYGQTAALRRCLESVVAQETTGIDYEIIVVDNGTPGGLADIAVDFPRVRFLTERRRGAASARNFGMKNANGAVFAFIDADCVAHPTWLEAGVRALEHCDLVGGEVVVSVDDEKQPTAVEAFERIFAFRQRTYIVRKHFSVTANLFARRGVAESIGDFNPDVAEDVDWCHRARTLGFHLAFNDTAIISHPARRTFDELKGKWERLIVERWNGFGGRRRFRRLIWAGAAIATALSTAPHLARVVFSRRIKGLRNRAAAAGVLARIRFWRARRMLAML